MRGEHRFSGPVSAVYDGIIPACAGSTRLSSRLACNCLRSSPHARGALLDVVDLKPLGGIIPACAGSTPRSHCGSWPYWGSSPHARGARGSVRQEWRVATDHPRMRGEHQPFEHVLVGANGIIPACAGSTSDTRCNSSVFLGSSPHARGALSDSDIEKLKTEGSSPHARGARSR